MKDKNLNDYLDNLLSSINLPSDEELRYETKATKVSIARKTQKATDKTKMILSKAHIGKKRTADSVGRSIKGLKQTWIEKMALIHSRDSIIEAQIRNDNHQANILDDLKITFNTYMKLLKHYGLEDKKKTNEEKTQWAKTNQSDAVLVWKEGKSGNPIGKPKTYYSVSECCRALSLPNKGRMLEKMSKGLPYHGYFFQKEIK